METLRGIGAMARESGLTVSALRFYDGAGLLGPAHVDPHSGYRFYAPDQLVVARLVATLRRVGMPLAGIREVLEHRHDPAAVDALCAGHLRRLEQGVVDARREISSVRILLDPEENPVPTTLTLPAAALADALRAVRFAAGADPGFPVLGGVLLDVGPDALTVVATDRYRLAVASVPGGATPAVAAVVPAAFADRLAALRGEVELTIDGAEATARCGGEVVSDRLLDEAFPDHRRLSPAAGTPVPVHAEQLRSAIAAGGAARVPRGPDGSDVDVTVLSVDPAGRLVVGTGADGVAVNVEFLLQAVEAGGAGQLVLELDGPLTPVAIRGGAGFSLLMPVRL